MISQDNESKVANQEHMAAGNGVVRTKYQSSVTGFHNRLADPNVTTATTVKVQGNRLIRTIVHKKNNVEVDRAIPIVKKDPTIKSKPLVVRQIKTEPLHWLNYQEYGYAGASTSKDHPRETTQQQHSQKFKYPKIEQKLNARQEGYRNFAGHGAGARTLPYSAATSTSPPSGQTNVQGNQKRKYSGNYSGDDRQQHPQESKYQKTEHPSYAGQNTVASEFSGTATTSNSPSFGQTQVQGDQTINCSGNYSENVREVPVVQEFYQTVQRSTTNSPDQQCPQSNWSEPTVATPTTNPAREDTFEDLLNEFFEPAPNGSMSGNQQPEGHAIHDGATNCQYSDGNYPNDQSAFLYQSQEQSGSSNTSQEPEPAQSNVIQDEVPVVNPRVGLEDPNNISLFEGVSPEDRKRNLELQREEAENQSPPNSAKPKFTGMTIEYVNGNYDIRPVQEEQRPSNIFMEQPELLPDHAAYQPYQHFYDDNLNTEFEQPPTLEAYQELQQFIQEGYQQFMEVNPDQQYFAAQKVQAEDQNQQQYQEYDQNGQQYYQQEPQQYFDARQAQLQYAPSPAPAPAPQSPPQRNQMQHNWTVATQSQQQPTSKPYVSRGRGRPSGSRNNQNKTDVRQKDEPYKTAFTYDQLAALAINNAPNKMANVSEMYPFVLKYFFCFGPEPREHWRSSLRHAVNAKEAIFTKVLFGVSGSCGASYELTEYGKQHMINSLCKTVNDHKNSKHLLRLRNLGDLQNLLTGMAEFATVQKPIDRSKMQIMPSFPQMSMLNQNRRNVKYLVQDVTAHGYPASHIRGPSHINYAQVAHPNGYPASPITGPSHMNTSSQNRSHLRVAAPHAYPSSPIAGPSHINYPPMVNMEPNYGFPSNQAPSSDMGPAAMFARNAAMRTEACRPAQMPMAEPFATSEQQHMMQGHQQNMNPQSPLDEYFIQASTSQQAMYGQQQNTDPQMANMGQFATNANGTMALNIYANGMGQDYYQQQQQQIPQNHGVQMDGNQEEYVPMEYTAMQNDMQMDTMEQGQQYQNYDETNFTENWDFDPDKNM